MKKVFKVLLVVSFIFVNIYISLCVYACIIVGLPILDFKKKLIIKEFEKSENVLRIDEIRDDMDLDAKWRIFFTSKNGNKFDMYDVEFMDGEIVFSVLFRIKEDLDWEEIKSNTNKVSEVLKEIDSF